MLHFLIARTCGPSGTASVYLPYLAKYVVRSENKPLLLLGRKLHTTRVDFIYRHYPREQDILFAEEKKDGSGVTEDLLKCDRLRVAHLHHWASQAATEYKDVADEYLESVSLQWAGLTASLYGSRRFVLQATNNTQPAILHYEKSTFAVPASPEDPIAYNQLADCLSTAISVQVPIIQFGLCEH